MENRTEVVKVTRLDYTFDRQLALEREDSREEGLAEGRAEGLAEGRNKQRILLISKKIAREKSLEQIAEELEEDTENIRTIYNVVCNMKPDFDVDEVYKRIYQAESPLS